MDSMLKRYSYHLHGNLDFGLRVIKRRMFRGEKGWRPMAFVPPAPPRPPKAPKRPGWAAARRKTIERDGHCQKCRSTRGLEVHHKLERVYGGGDDLENLIALCDLCHAEWTWCQPGVISFDQWLLIPPARMLVAAWALPWPENKSAAEFRRELVVALEAARIAHEKTTKT